MVKKLLSGGELPLCSCPLLLALALQADGQNALQKYCAAAMAADAAAMTAKQTGDMNTISLVWSNFQAVGSSAFTPDGNTLYAAASSMEAGGGGSFDRPFNELAQIDASSDNIHDWKVQKAWHVIDSLALVDVKATEDKVFVLTYQALGGYGCAKNTVVAVDPSTADGNVQTISGPFYN